MFKLFRVDTFLLWPSHERLTSYYRGEVDEGWTAFLHSWEIVGRIANHKQFVGTWKVRPNTTMKWLNERNPRSSYFIQSILPLGSE